MTIPLLTITNLTKIYSPQQTPAVKNACFTLNKGQILTLLGPSGCGKTTILRAIAGLEIPEKGFIAFDRKVLFNNKVFIPPEKRGIGMVFQDYALFPHLTVAQNIEFALSKDSKNVVKQQLELVGLTGVAHKYPAQLSGGQQQRVALARTLAVDPKLILFDEPFSNLDMSLREKMRWEIRQIIKHTSTTAIFVTHDQKEALSLSDRIIVMNSGEIIQSGTPRDIYQNPANLFVASFVGHSNILQGTIKAGGKSVNTSIGNFPCDHTHGKKPGENVLISVRPESLELDPNGIIRGILLSYFYKGDTIDAIIKVFSSEGNKKLRVHIHPEIEVSIGQWLGFSVLSRFVAVIDQEE